MLAFEQYRKSYHGNLVLHIPQLLLPAGVYWLQGINGAGKSTLLRSIAGLLSFEGTIRVEQKDVKKQRMAYLQTVNWLEAEPLYPSFLTGNELIRFYLDTKKGDRQQTRLCAEALGVDKFGPQKVQTYSSGMTKKLAILLAFIGQPRLILMDEPLITLDATAMQTCMGLVKEAADKGVSFLMTSHQPFDLGGLPVQQLSIANQTIEAV